jgi:hypothetical protein
LFRVTVLLGHESNAHCLHNPIAGLNAIPRESIEAGSFFD